MATTSSKWCVPILDSLKGLNDCYYSKCKMFIDDDCYYSECRMFWPIEIQKTEVHGFQTVWTFSHKSLSKICAACPAQNQSSQAHCTNYSYYEVSRIALSVHNMMWTLDTWWYLVCCLEWQFFIFFGVDSAAKPAGDLQTAPGFAYQTKHITAKSRALHVPT